MKNEDMPLRAVVKDGQLIISVGINIIAFCSNITRDGFKITNPQKFAEDMINVMDEETSGEVSFLTNFLDGILDRTLESSEHVESAARHNNEN